MSAQENKVIARQFCEETWSKENLAAVDELASCDFKVYLARREDPHYTPLGLVGDERR